MESELFNALVGGDSRKAEELTEKELKSGTDPVKLVHDVILPALKEVGKRYECNEYFVPELLIAARAVRCSFAVLRPMLMNLFSTAKGCVVIGAVLGELHDIGIFVIGQMLECSGFKVVNLGVDVRADKFVEAVRHFNPDIIMLSASNLLQITYPKYVIEALEKAGLRNKVKVVVGGVNITQGYADEIGADGYAENAAEAVRLAHRLV